MGFCCTEPVPARHIYEPSRQMHNRGNGKGGGIAALGFIPEQLGVSRKVLEDYYMLHVAFLDPGVRAELEKKYISANFEVTATSKLDTVDDWTTGRGPGSQTAGCLALFCTCKTGCAGLFISENSLPALTRDEAEEEFINQNSIRLNQEYYASLGEQKAFVMSEGKNIMILKVVGLCRSHHQIL